MGASGWGISRRWVLVLVLSVVLAMAPATGAAAEPLDAPEVTAGSVYAYNIATGDIIYDVNADERRPVGSLAKLMTALVTLDHRAPDEEVVITEADMVPAGYSTMWLQAGDTLTVAQLLTGVLLPSGGDAARALARDIGAGLSGSDDPDIAVAAFVEAMNGRAAELGLGDTRFANPDGEDADGAWSTAHDIALMFGEVQEYALLTGILAQTEYGFVSVGPERRAYSGLTTNELAGQYRVTGAKTGSTEAAGGCLVLSRTANQEQTRVIIALLGSNLVYDETGIQIEDDRWTDAAALIEDMDMRWQWGEPNAEPALIQSGVKPAAKTGSTAAPGSAPAAAPANASSTAPARTVQAAAPGGRETLQPPYGETLAIGIAGGMVVIASGSTWVRLRTGRA